MSDENPNAELDAKWKTAKRLWVEDDVSYIDKESGEQAWRRLFGVDKPKEALAMSDHGDAFYYEYPKGRLYCMACDGAEIRQVAEQPAATPTEPPKPPQSELENLRRFKEYVHQCLDAMGIPPYPPSPHLDAGCRVGARLEVVAEKLYRLQSLDK